MYDAPMSLREACLELLHESITRPTECSEEQKQADAIVVGNLRRNQLIMSISEQLLERMARSQKLTDQKMIELFSADKCTLQDVRISDASLLTQNGLRVLKGHKLRRVQVVGLEQATINELIGCFNEHTLRNLIELNVTRSSFMSSTKFCVVVSLSKLTGLESLDVSHSEFNHQGLELVVEDMKRLTCLNISATRVRDLTPLRKCKDRLRSLSMYNLKPNLFGADFFAILCEMRCLVKLDISDDREQSVSDSTKKLHDCSSMIISNPEKFLQLTYLDISGREGVTDSMLKKFIREKHSLGRPYQLTFLGLLQTGLFNNDSFAQASDPFCANIFVTGSSTEQQVLNALHAYADRANFVQKSMCYLYNYTINCETDRVDLIEAIIPAMKKHAKVLGIQMAASACLYNLTKGKAGDLLQAHHLAKVVDVTLDAMEQFANQAQLQKNTLLTLCSDRILQSVSFDRFRCTKLVMESLVNFSDNSMNRMAVAICSILAAKITTTETSFLGAHPVYMETLLHIVKTRVQMHEEPDIMLKFTLSALWNLTDESPITCEMFLEKGGTELYLTVLDNFTGHPAVETKVLGLLNNIAEVASLRGGLFKDDFIACLLTLLRSEHIDVSYFSAGIFAHMLSDGELSWKCNIVTREDVIENLQNTVMNWKPPECEMVAYRSFVPFLPLLACHNTPVVQLWAVWAINHVVSKNPDRYCPMLLEERTLNMFKQVYNQAKCTGNQVLFNYCNQTVSVVRTGNPHLFH